MIEICCGSIADVMAARYGGAARVELCSALEVGGVTPSPGLIVAAVRECGGMQVNMLVRPRAGDFVYSRAEVAVMLADIAAAREAGVHGIVAGALTPDGELDTVVMRRLLEAARGMDFTFHRAIDVSASPERLLVGLVELGVGRVLTSGASPSAMQGAPLIARLAELGKGRISVMPGGGINADNIADIERLTGASEFHSTASDKQCARLECPLFGPRPYATSEAIVRRLVDA